MVSWKRAVTGTKAEVTWGGISWMDWLMTYRTERQTVVLTSRILLSTRLHTTYDQLNWAFKSTALRTSLTLTLLAEVSGDNCEDSQFSLGTYCTHCVSLLYRKETGQNQANGRIRAEEEPPNHSAAILFCGDRMLHC